MIVNCLSYLQRELLGGEYGGKMFNIGDRILINAPWFRVHNSKATVIQTPCSSGTKYYRVVVHARKVFEFSLLETEMILIQQKEPDWRV
jgi:hypothetical protein